MLSLGLSLGLQFPSSPAGKLEFLIPCPCMVVTPQTLLSPAAACALPQPSSRKVAFLLQERRFLPCTGLAGNPREGTFSSGCGGALQRAAAVNPHKG